ncbi:ogr/Delta-like zinc finger family protein (plasmid) [Paraburkholderia sp. D15]|uniref:ogr/Delta-like zinc finger family protein n=1 Tax=Paraburkholderia sp. D15 TaxID=2880218 RepID=UPI00247941C5|nr:ogr/Delta-like zinc finger family protein [Paraburkholderia sp. D15]WGS54913.1 ogr/Delta-like zinc finger family protein [Paraburkholderia sp. D15]
MRFTIACPHCGARGIARAMEKRSETDWEIDFQCDDVTCGHTYRTRLEMRPPVLPIPRRPRRITAELLFDL